MALSPDRAARRVAGGRLWGLQHQLGLARRGARPRHRQGGSRSARPARATPSTLWSLDFSPCRRRHLAIGGKSGGVWLWKLGDKEARLLGRHRVQGTSPQTVRLVAFLAGDRLLSVSEAGPAARLGSASSRAGSAPCSTSTSLPRHRVVISGRSPLGGRRRHHRGKERIATPSTASRSAPSGTGKGPGHLLRPHPEATEHCPRCEGPAPGSRPAHHGGQGGLPPRARGRVDLFDLTDPAGQPRPGPRPSFYPQVLAFHPDGRRLAMIDAEDFRAGLHGTWNKPAAPSPVAPSEGRLSLWRRPVGRSGTPPRHPRRAQPPAFPPQRPRARGRGRCSTSNVGPGSTPSRASSRSLPSASRAAGKSSPIRLDQALWFVVHAGLGKYHPPLDLGFDHWPRLLHLPARRPGQARAVWRSATTGA